METNSVLQPKTTPGALTANQVHAITNSQLGRDATPYEVSTLSTAPIHLNGPAAAAAGTAVVPDKPIRLDLFSLPSRNTAAGWRDGNFYKDSNLVSIMQRVPTHEPWDQHENINPSQFTSVNTDVQVNQPIDGPSSPTAGQSTVPVNNNPVSPPVSKNAAANEAYCQAVFVQSGVTDPIQLAAWMAQCKQESQFIYLKEFASGSEYEGRSDLGNTQPAQFCY